MEDRSEPGSKRLKVTERCPPELEVVFRSCNSPWLQFKLLQASPLQFLPLVPGAVNRRLTDGDKQLISRWLDKLPDAWSPDFDPNSDSLKACAVQNAPTALQFLLDITSENLNPQTLLSQAYRLPPILS